ncbi:MAG: hypothetical protein A2X32_13095 [Elusimicrobia bacterium GWC2_64_44]|nr:MAG: hypothetical protein A2X32_13095 [Elusimicrobia bacterium GWC2_64_44]
MKARMRPGQSLIEVTMATMIAAITTTAVFSVVLSSFVSDARADKRDAAAMAVRHAQEVLKSFVSVDPYNPLYAPTSALGTGRWQADTSGAWALRDGRHWINSLVQQPGSPLSPAGVPAATMFYDVQSYQCAWFGTGAGPDFPMACKRVTFRLDYTD